jgi:hypothetical protein
MRPRPPSHLGALHEGFALFRRHPFVVLALSCLAMLLTQMGPALELAARVESTLVLQAVFGFVALLPLEMYFLPRLMARLDAETLDLPGNPTASWEERFDARWVRSFLARLGLSVAIGLGLLLFFIPGLIVLTLFGWMPLRILLRGDDLMEALRWSQSAMARHWPRIVQAVLAVILVALSYQLGAGWLLDRVLPPSPPDLGPDALLRLKHPAFWVFNLLGGALNLWISCTLLALYHRLEAAVTHPLGEGGPA